MSRRVAWITGAALALAAFGLFSLHLRWGIPLQRPDLDLPALSTTGVAVQLVALVVGVVAIHTVSPFVVPYVIAAQGTICLLAHGPAGVVFLVAVLTWWAVLEARAWGRWRFALAAALLIGLDACAWATLDIRDAALWFSLMFTLRLVVYAYDRWQAEDERVPLRVYASYMLTAPLIVMPPFMAIIPLFGGFGATLKPGLDVHRALTIAGHVVLAIVWALLRFVVGVLDLPAIPGNVIETLLGFAALAHLYIALLKLHGIEERAPIDRPLVATRYVEWWQRFGAHLRDAQMFLFYTPALLHWRRHGKRTAIIAAVAWTMIVGNTLLHVVTRYCFVSDPVHSIVAALVANTVIAGVLAVELTTEIRIGWAPTMIVAALIGAL